MQPGSSSSKVDRRAMEKKRRSQMKDLLSSLASLIPFKIAVANVVGSNDYLCKAIERKSEELKLKKEELTKGGENSIKNNTEDSTLPVIAVRDTESILEVNLITGLNKRLKLSEVFSILEDEGTATIVSASYSIVGDKIFYTIYTEAIFSRIGIETSRIHERLKKLVF